MVKKKFSSPEEDLSKYDDIMVDTLTDSDDNVSGREDSIGR